MQFVTALPYVARTWTPRSWFGKWKEDGVDENQYKKLRVVAVGSAGKVYEACHLETGTQVAIKELPIQRNLRRQVRKEAEILRKASSKSQFICTYVDYQETSKTVHLITEFLKGGDLLEAINGQVFTERRAKNIIKQVASALTTIHSLSYVHLDIKCENICLTQNDTCKIVDFGSARNFYDSKPALSATTIANAPPEVFSHGEVRAVPTVDVWALGIVTFLLLTGHHPFDLYATQNDDLTVSNILTGFQHSQAERLPAYLRLSPQAQQFISSCLAQSPDKRPSSYELLSHPWFSSS